MKMNKRPVKSLMWARCENTALQEKHITFSYRLRGQLEISVILKFNNFTPYLLLVDSWAIFNPIECLAKHVSTILIEFMILIPYSFGHRIQEIIRFVWQ